MPDTQWPRYYVFEQPEDGGPMIHAGSVHASDREMALLIARDIFARRPSRTTMWVVRDRDIFSRTNEELGAQDAGMESDDVTTVSAFHVFVKKTHKGVCVHLGEVRAGSHPEALQKAMGEFSDRAGLLWWIIRDEDVVRNDPEDDNVYYGSSPGKEYRHESHFPVRTMMMQLKQKNRAKDD